MTSQANRAALVKSERKTKRSSESPKPFNLKAIGGLELQNNATIDWYNVIIRNAKEGILLLGGPPGKILDVNDAFCHMLGYSREKLLNMSLQDFAIDLSMEKVTQRFQNVRELGGASFTAQHRRKDGEIIDVLVSISYIDIGQGLRLCFHRDISEQKKVAERLEESENRYRTFVELGAEAGEAIVMVQDIDGKEGVQTFVSDQWPRITGYTRGAAGNTIFDLESPRGPPGFYRKTPPEDRRVNPCPGCLGCPLFAKTEPKFQLS